MSNPIVDAITDVNKAFEELKSTNERALKEERAGNEARTRELKEQVDRINTDLDKLGKEKTVLERKAATQQERLEILEALNDRPGKSAADKVRDEHLTLFLKWIRSGGKDNQVYSEYKALERKALEFKDVLIGTNLAGGFALPEQIGTAIDKLILKFSDIVNQVKLVQVGTSDYKELVTINGGNSAWSSETGTRSATNTPNLRERAPTWGELYSYPQASNFALEDIFFNVIDWLVSDISEGMSVQLSQAVFDGNGTAKPTGMTATAPVTTDDYASPLRAAAAFEYIPISGPSSPQATAGITIDTLLDLVYLCRAGYRSNGKFAMNSISLGHLRKKKDTTNQYLWQPSVQAGEPDRLFGYPVFVWEEMGNPTTANAYPVAFGDFRRAYLMCTRSQLQVTQEGFTTPGYTKFYVRRRYGGCPLNNDAVKFAKVED